MHISGKLAFQKSIYRPCILKCNIFGKFIRTFSQLFIFLNDPVFWTGRLFILDGIEQMWGAIWENFKESHIARKTQKLLNTEKNDFFSILEIVQTLSILFWKMSKLYRFFFGKCRNFIDSHRVSVVHLNKAFAFQITSNKYSEFVFQITSNKYESLCFK